MGARTPFFVAAVFAKTAFTGVAMAAQIAAAVPGDDDGYFARSDIAPVELASVQVMPIDPVARPSPVPLPTSLALIGSSLVVLALVGVTL